MTSNAVPLMLLVFIRLPTLVYYRWAHRGVSDNVPDGARAHETSH
jgi:hypothetical protein